MEQTSTYLTHEEFKRAMADNGRRNASVHFNPVDRRIYIGERYENHNSRSYAVPTWEEPVFDMAKYEQAKQLASAGKLDSSEASFMPWLGRFADAYNERIGVKSAAATGGVGSNALYATIDTTTVLAGFEGTELRGFTIPDAVTTIPVTTLEYNIDVWSRFNISQSVPEGVAAFEKAGGVSTVSYDLTKDVAHIANTFEALMKARQDIRATAIDNAATDFRRSMANTIAAVLVSSSVTETNAGDWDAVSSGLSTANPLADIQTQIDTIIANNGTPDTIISCGNVFAGFAGNTFIRGAYNNQQQGLATNGAMWTTFSQLPNIRWGVDNELLSTSAVIFDKRAVVNVVGPSRLGTYVKEPEAVEGIVYRKWYQCKITQSSKIQEMVTVLS